MILVDKSDRILSVVKRDATKNEKHQIKIKRATHLQLWWSNTYTGVPVVHSPINILVKLKSQGSLDLQLLPQQGKG